MPNTIDSLPKLTPKTVSGTNILTGVVRLSYCQLFAPKAGPDGGEPVYSCAVLIPKTDTATLGIVKAAMKAAAIAKWGTEEKARAQAERDGFRKGLRDGDQRDDAAYKGHMFFNCRSKNKPQIVDTQRNPITSPELCRSGDYARVNVNVFAFQNKGVGIAFGLNNIQVIAKGEPLAGGPDAVDVFDNVEGVPGTAAHGGGGGSDPDDLF